jgi:iron complex transport system ATP-binding protein
MEALSSMGLTQFADRAFTKLSGGEKQLVMIARSLAQDADIILLDEPTSSLDVKNEMMVLKRIKDMVRKTDKTVVLATHQPNHAYYFENENLAVNAALFVRGRIKHFGAPSKVLTKQNIAEVYNVECEILQYSDERKAVVAR